MRRNRLWNFLVAFVFATVAGIGFSMCRSAPKQNYRGWKKYTPEDYNLASSPTDSSDVILLPFCNKFFHDEDLVHYFPASGGYVTIQFNPEIDYLSRDNAHLLGAVHRLLYTKSERGNIELTLRDLVSPGDVYYFLTDEEMARYRKGSSLDWMNGGGQTMYSGRIKDHNIGYWAGKDHWLQYFVNGDTDTVEIILRPNKTGRLRVMTIVFSATYGSDNNAGSFVNNAIYVIQGW